MSPIHDRSGQIIGVSMVARDITEVKRAEEELRRVAAELQERNADLLRSNQELDDFAYIASHDMKEPLRGIHNYATFLIEDYGERLDIGGRSKLETLKVLTERMYALIDSLLEFSRVGRVDLAIQKTDLNVLLDDVLRSISILMEEKGVRLRIPVPLPTIRCDRVRIGEVFRNLITNAIKYNDKPEKWIEITWQSDPASAESQRQTVTRTGRMVRSCSRFATTASASIRSTSSRSSGFSSGCTGETSSVVVRASGSRSSRKSSSGTAGGSGSNRRWAKGQHSRFVLGGEDARNGRAASDPGGRR